MSNSVEYLLVDKFNACGALYQLNEGEYLKMGVCKDVSKSWNSVILWRSEVTSKE